MLKLLYETGLNEALRGMSYSFRDEATPPEEFWTEERQKRALTRAGKLAWMSGGHNKFLESIVVCFELRASRAFWSEFDTYRVGVTKQSCSTMHTLTKTPPTAANFHPSTPAAIIGAFCAFWETADKADITTLKMALPEGYMQTRVVTTNYKVLQNIFAQRRGHRLKQWDEILDELKGALMFPEWVEK